MNRKNILIIVLLGLLQPLLSLYSFEVFKDGILLELQNYQATGVKALRIKLCSDDIIQVIGLPIDADSMPVSLVVDDRTFKRPAFKIEERAAEIHINIKNLKVIVTEDNGLITIKNVRR